MKKYLLSLFLGYSGIVSALGNCEENFLFDVVIINKTSQDCSLLNYSVDNGQIQSKQLTTTIQSGMQGQRYNFCDPSNYYKQTLVTMNVQCGTDKFVTLQTQRKLDTTFFSYAEYIEGNTTGVSNMNASYTSIIARHRNPSNIPSTIYWTLQE